MGSIFAVVVGGSLGCLLRPLLSFTLTSFYPAVPPGTLIVNLIGGYLIGLSFVFFALILTSAPEWRLFVLTGFLRGMTTFAAFSLEARCLRPCHRLIGRDFVGDRHIRTVPPCSSVTYAHARSSDVKSPFEVTPGA